MIAAIDRIWGGLLWLLMALAAIYIGLMLVSIVYMTVFRSMGWEYTGYAFVFIEYGFIYTLFLGSPWLIRHRGHVYIEMLTAALSPRWRGLLSRLIATACAVTCLIWAWYSGHLAYDDYLNETYDELRAQFDILRWMTTIAFPVGFSLMGVEFLRFVFARLPMHAGVAGVASERSELEEQQKALAERT